MRKCLYAGVALMLAMLVAACGGGGKGPAGVAATKGAAGSSKPYAELHWGSGPWPGPVDATTSYWPQPQSVESLVAQTLVEFEPSGNLKPALASSVEHPNPTTYIYNLRSGARFSDGKPVTVADVIFSLGRDAHGKESVWASEWEDVSSISARGNSAVVVKLKRPDAVWPDVVGFTSQIIEKAQAEQVGEKALGTSTSTMPIGSGPWKFDSYQPEVSVHLSRNPHWTGAPQPAAKIAISIFKSEATMALALRSGAIDGAFYLGAPKIFANIPSVRRLTAPGGFLAMLQMNTTRPPFNDVHVRRAIAYATDVKGITNALNPGTATEDVTISPSSLFAGLGSASQVSAMLGSLPKYDFNLEAAKRELAKSAYPHGFTTKMLALSAESNMVAAAQIVASDLAKIGITAAVHTFPDNLEESEVYNNKMTIWANEYFSPYPDPEGLMASLLPPEQIRTFGLNDAKYRNAEVDTLQPEELETLNPTARLKLIGKLLKIEGEEVPYMPLFTHDMIGALSERYVFPTFSNWTVNFTPWALGVKLAH